MAIKACVVCGGEFLARGRTKYCSEKCRHEKEIEREHKWRVDNAQICRERNRQWELNNPEKVREWKRRWKAKNREKLREQNRQWRTENPEKSREQSLKSYYKHREKHQKRAAHYNSKRTAALAILKDLQNGVMP